MTDSGIGFAVLLILLMIIANGIFSMSEIAVVSSRKSRLEQQALEGDTNAKRALELASHPNRFLSTVQVGMTLVGIFTGAYGGSTIASQIDVIFEGLPWVGQYSEGLALAVVVIVITYLTLVIGELVPKRIGMTHPEKIAGIVAAPMNALSVVASPIVKLLSLSTDVILRLLGVRKGNEPPVTEAEITAMIEQGTQAGVFQEEEQDLVERVFWLGDQRVVSLMTPRWKIAWLDVSLPFEQLRDRLMEHRFSRFLVCDGGLDRVLGMVEVKDLLARLLAGEKVELRESLRKPLYVPEGMRALRLLELFRESAIKLAVVVDEYGGISGIVTLNDVLDEITGEYAAALAPQVTQREDGSWLVDASLSMEELWEHLDLEERREAQRGDYHTVGGFVFATLGHIPRPGEYFDSYGFRLEVVDMDGNRVDKVLVTERDEPAEPSEDED
jgi:putative hemolysin